MTHAEIVYMLTQMLVDQLINLKISPVNVVVPKEDSHSKNVSL